MGALDTHTSTPALPLRVAGGVVMLLNLSATRVCFSTLLSLPFLFLWLIKVLLAMTQSRKISLLEGAT